MHEMGITYWRTDVEQFSGSGTDAVSAEAAVTAWKLVAGNSDSGECRCVAECYFWGFNVPPEIDGVLQTVEFVIPLDWAITEWRSALITAVQNKATELNLSVISANVRLPSYEIVT